MQGGNVIIYGGGGAIGGASAQAFARAGATVHLVGRRQSKLRAVAEAIIREGGDAHAAALDIFDAEAISHHAETVAARGGIAAAMVAIGVTHVQGRAIADLSLDEFEAPITAYMRAHFIAAKAVAPHLSANGVFIALSTQAATLAFPVLLGFGTTCAAIEGFIRHLSRDLAPRGARAVCVRCDAIPEAVEAGSHSAEVFEAAARAQGVSVSAMLADAARATPLQRLPTLTEAAACAVFAASPAARNMTGAVINLTGGVS